MPATKIPSSLMKIFLKKEIGNSKRVLDIGCGDGILALYLISSLNCRIDGIDIESGNVHRANAKFKKKTKKGLALCRLCSADSIDRKFKKNSFDVVLIIHTFHHLIDLNDILRKIRLILRQNGKLIISEYHRDYGEKIDNCPRFSIKKIKSMIKTAGFSTAKNHNLSKNLVMITATKFRGVKP